MGEHHSGCSSGCNDSHDYSDHHSVDYWGGPDHQDDKGGGCFPASALIKTITGEVPLGHVEGGHIILSWSGNGRLVPRRVTRKIAYGRKPIAHVAFEDGSWTNTTSSQSFLTSAGWKRVNQVELGDIFIALSGPRKVVNVSLTSNREKVFNLYSETEHNFIADGCIAHNFSYLRILRTAMHHVFFDELAHWPLFQC